MLGLGVNSFISGAFQYKHYFRLQLVPHISRHHQVRAILHIIYTVFDALSAFHRLDVTNPPLAC